MILYEKLLKLNDCLQKIENEFEGRLATLKHLLPMQPVTPSSQMNVSSTLLNVAAVQNALLPSGATALLADIYTINEVLEEKHKSNVVISKLTEGPDSSTDETTLLKLRSDICCAIPIYLNGKLEFDRLRRSSNHLRPLRVQLPNKNINATF